MKQVQYKTFWRVFDEQMERLNTNYVKMGLATSAKQFDHAFSEYIRALRQCADRSLALYDDIINEEKLEQER